MRTIKAFAILAFALLIVTAPLQAQTTTPSTTLAAAIASPSNTTPLQMTIQLTSSAGVSIVYPPSGLVIDAEYFLVKGVGTGGFVTVLRGQGGTKAAQHAAGAVVWIGTAGQSGPFITGTKAGACTSTNELYLPQILVPGNPYGVPPGTIFNCVNSIWITQNEMPPYVPSGLAAPNIALRACNVPVGSVAYASFGTNTTMSATTTYVSSIYLPQSQLVTGISFLKGTTAGTDSVTLALYPATGGAVIAKSASTAIGATGNIFKDIPFSSTIYLPGPAYYFYALQDNGTTDTIRTVATATFPNVLASSVTAGTYGTFLSLTAPTTFTADKGVIACLY